MRIVSIQRKNWQWLAVFSVAVVVLNYLAIRFLAADDIENVNLENLQGRRIAIDPGHGGIDSGASGHGVIEKEVNMAIAGKVTKILQDHGAVIFLSREGDNDYYTRGKGGKRNDLLTRIDKIEQAQPEVFVSIHCNAIKGPDLSGAQVFYSPKFEQSKQLAEVMQRALKDFPPGNRRQAKQDLHILMLNGIKVPGVLVETGYLTNKKEASRLADPAYQEELAGHIAKALAYHFSKNAGQ
ncbi:putative membrane protein [Propionispora sp. 2/2-37]|uniref:N-acetylmuramoyl-L-alanine amidase family protein n=1 Tax=Propionispora sp. 2/2-37 TaxID=1677858 RepID=UPI0006C14755|nr:N-acetylmuramoyl-L-alanine amidase [Propionispora sp. 2/2-37]CUH95187.1 putative membrane protein [Propionispora sp. 2/2-37]